MIVYDGEGLLLGRLASVVAKATLLGQEVKVVNCDKILISGKKVNIFANEKAKRLRKGYPLKSAKLTRMPDRFVRRTIRGMLPWKIARGKEAFNRVMCYRGIPEEYAKEKLLTVEKASVKKLPNLRYITVGEVCKNLGGKVE